MFRSKVLLSLITKQATSNVKTFAHACLPPFIIFCTDSRLFNATSIVFITDASFFLAYSNIRCIRKGHAAVLGNITMGTSLITAMAH